MPWGWKPYVSAAQRRAEAERYAEKLAKGGRQLQPVKIQGRAMAATFWGKAWCENLERYSDFANRLPRGRTYARNGSVIDVQITAGQITAIVSGSEIYDVSISITPLKGPDWKKIQTDCSQSIQSLLDLLQGRFSDGVMERLTRKNEGLFPHPGEIEIECSCPDWAFLCKHAAAVLYGVGARLDTDPELLFQLRKVDHLELIAQAVDGANLDAALTTGESDSLAREDLESLFGIELGGGEAEASQEKQKVSVKDTVRKYTQEQAAKRTSPKKKSAKKKAVVKKKPAAKSSRRKKTAKSK